MQRSTQRILTTHAGSLPRPDALIDAWSKPTTSGADEERLSALLRTSVADVVSSQIKAGIDIPNDGEFGKPMRARSDLAAWGTYIYGRLSGFGPTPPGAGAPARVDRGKPMRIVGERHEMRDFAEFYRSGDLVPSMASRPCCIGPVSYTGQAAIKRDIDDLEGAVQASGVKETFMTSVKRQSGPGCGDKDTDSRARM
jgi:5-methyltetrahydropteroyltriglutamate--homocysteine methyltransferase